ncbi:MAG: DUF1566 domain-containing protein [Methylococcales bacterium]
MFKRIPHWFCSCVYAMRHFKLLGKWLCQFARWFSGLILSLALGVTVADAAPYTLSADGQEVTDTQTGLIWRRCAEGMSWNGTLCIGTATTYTHEQALQQAATVATATGIAWRLPNVKELVSIVDFSRISPAIDPAAFPNTLMDVFWSSSPEVSGTYHAWTVEFGWGYTSIITNDAGAVRLVRAGQ